MSAVEGLLDRAIGGDGAVVGVVGPAGIGKSRLARELAAMAAERDVNVFTTFCESHTSQVPFQVIFRLLRAATGVESLDPRAARALIKAQFSDAESEDVALFEDLLGISDPGAELPRIDPDARKRRLTAMVNSATLASQDPAVYVIEDAHWIDESSESLLADFLTVVPQTHLLTLITHRAEYRGALAQVPGAQSIALSPLATARPRRWFRNYSGRTPPFANSARRSPKGPQAPRSSRRRSYANSQNVVCCKGSSAHTCQRQKLPRLLCPHAAGNDHLPY